MRTGVQLVMDGLTDLSYFVAANPSIDRHVYSAALPTMPSVETFAEQLTALTDVKQPGYFDVSFSPSAGYYLLSYRGPDVPYQRLIEAKEDGEPSNIVQHSS